MALYAIPEEFLKSEVQRSQSAWTHLKEGLEEKFVDDIARELKNGSRDRK